MRFRSQLQTSKLKHHKHYWLYGIHLYKAMVIEVCYTVHNAVQMTHVDEDLCALVFAVGEFHATGMKFVHSEVINYIQYVHCTLYGRGCYKPSISLEIVMICCNASSRHGLSFY